MNFKINIIKSSFLILITVMAFHFILYQKFQLFDLSIYVLLIYMICLTLVAFYKRKTNSKFGYMLFAFLLLTTIVFFLFSDKIGQKIDHMNQTRVQLSLIENKSECYVMYGLIPVKLKIRGRFILRTFGGGRIEYIDKKKYWID